MFVFVSLRSDAASAAVETDLRSAVSSLHPLEGSPPSTDALAVQNRHIIGPDQSEFAVGHAITVCTVRATPPRGWSRAVGPPPSPCDASFSVGDVAGAACGHAVVPRRALCSCTNIYFSKHMVLGMTDKRPPSCLCSCLCVRTRPRQRLRQAFGPQSGSSQSLGRPLDSRAAVTGGARARARSASR